MRRDRLVLTLFAFGGGYADAAGMLRYHTFAGHVTGNLVLMAISLANAQWADVLLRSVAVSCFVLSTALGLRLARRARGNGRVIIAQGVLIPLACALQGSAARPELLGVAALCCSLGLQNGAFTTAAGVSLHSTFVSGDATSLFGSLLKVQPTAIAEVKERAQKIRVLSLLLASFVVGALTAAYLSRFVGNWLPCLVLAPLLTAGVLKLSAPVEAGN